MDTIFTKIVNGEIPSFKIAENDDFLAFLDIMPLKEGHTLVIPKLQVDYFYDLPDDHLANMIIFSKMVAKKIEKAMPCKRIGVTVIGLEVPHAHIHLIPINGIADMNFAKPKLNLSNNELALIASKINN